MLKRNKEKGEFWQPITGGVNEGESFKEAAVRELMEETEISKKLRLINTGYSFEFFDNSRKQFEKVFGIEVDIDVKVKLSKEHTDMKWATRDEALNKYLKWSENKEGLKRLCEKIKSSL